MGVDFADWLAPLEVTEFSRSVLGHRPLLTPASPRWRPGCARRRG
ncbi:hypothetical protein N8J89_27900 [Crossiella sp. CA-258035]|nr:hypothetical protein [Crossiella sp. CA-258035]WHT16940.1 hypothetical protein N8J89_27900 [Crossiella sp. CA-258035]